MSLSNDPGLQAALVESRRQTSEATRSLRRLAAHLAAERDTFKAESAQRRLALARQARTGELGPEQERLQRRVDAGETTWELIAAGHDTDPAAVAARAHLAENLAQLREELQDNEDFLEVDAEARAAQRRVSAEG